MGSGNGLVSGANRQQVMYLNQQWLKWCHMVSLGHNRWTFLWPVHSFPDSHSITNLTKLITVKCMRVETFVLICNCLFFNCLSSFPPNKVITALHVICVGKPPGPRLNIKTVFPRYGIPMLKIRWSWDRLIFEMGIPILARRHLYIEMAPQACSLFTHWTNWGRNKMSAILQLPFSNEFSWINMYEFRLRIHWSLFLRLEWTKLRHWFR